MDLKQNYSKITKEKLFPLIVFFLSLFVYTITLCHTVYMGDGGEFISNVYTLGVCHVPGFPLYTIVGKVFTFFLPFLETASAVNLFSAFSASLTVTFLYLIVERLTKNKIISIYSAFIFAFSATLWSRATVAEIYTFSILFVAIVLYLLVKWLDGYEFKYLILISYLAGLGLSQHFSEAVFFVSIILLVLLKQKEIILKPKAILVLLLFFVLGFSIYLYLPIRSSQDPPLLFRKISSLIDLQHYLFPSFAANMITGEVKNANLDVNGIDTISKMDWFLNQFFTQEFWYFGILGALGLLFLVKNWKLLVFFVSIIFINIHFTFQNPANLISDFDAQFLVIYFITAILIGLGLYGVMKYVEGKLSHYSNPILKNSYKFIFALLPLIILISNYSNSDKSKNDFAQIYGENFLTSAEKNAIVFVEYDEETFIPWYFKNVEGKRSDITIIPQRSLNPNPASNNIFNKSLKLNFQGLNNENEFAEAIIKSYIKSRPIYFTFRKIPWKFLEEDYQLVPRGILTQIVEKGNNVEYKKYDIQIKDEWGSIYKDKRLIDMADMFYSQQFLLNGIRWAGFNNPYAVTQEMENFFKFPLPPKEDELFFAHLLEGNAYFSLKKYDKALSDLQYVAQSKPDDWNTFQTIGLIYYYKKDYENAKLNWQKSLSFNSKNNMIKSKLDSLSLIK